MSLGIGQLTQCGDMSEKPSSLKTTQVQRLCEKKMGRFIVVLLILSLPYFTYGKEYDEGDGKRYPPLPPVGKTLDYPSKNTPPIYPKDSKLLKEEGTVLLLVLITTDGKVGVVEIKKSSGFQRLDVAAMEAVKLWTFNPATVDGKPVEKWFEIPITFKLKTENTPKLSESMDCSPDPTSWEKVFPDEELFVKLLGKVQIEPKGLIDRAKRALSSNDNGRMFRFAKNNVKLSDGNFGSTVSIRIADCMNRELLIQSESNFICPFGRGLESPSPDRDTIHFNNWLRISPGSRDDSIIKLVCSK